MAKKLVESDVIHNVEKEGYKLLDKYTNVRTKVKMLTPYGEVWETTIHNFNCGYRPIYKESLTYKKELARKYGCELLSNKNFSSKDYAEVRYPEGEVHRVIWGNFVNNRKNDRSFYKHTTFSEATRYIESFGYKVITNKEDFKDGRTKLSTVTPNGYNWDTTYASFKSGRRCPKENVSSYGERLVWYIVDKILKCGYKVSYEEQISIKERYLYFDFSIKNEDGEITHLIEYQGEQHYKYTPVFHQDYDGFVKQKHIDYEKREYCRNNGIILVEVPYTLSNLEVKDLLTTSIPSKIYTNFDFSSIGDNIRGFTRKDVVEYYKKGSTLQDTADKFNISKWTVNRYVQSIEGYKVKERHIKQINPITNAIVSIYKNQSEAMRLMDISSGSLPRVINKYKNNGERKTCKGYAWDWASRDEYIKFKENKNE